MRERALTDVFPWLSAYQMTPVGTGRSASSVYRLTCPGRTDLYLKTASPPHIAELEEEHARLEWLGGRAPVPEIVDFRASARRAALLTRALPGTSALHAARRDRAAVVRRLARALREWHAIPADGWRFDRSRAVVIEAARERVMAGRVDEAEFDEERKGQDARELLGLLEQEQPPSESLVVTHGDASLANAIFEGARFHGLVDCGRSGLADAYQDLALAGRSIAGNYGEEHVSTFFEAYGLQEVDDRKLAYYRLVDEFF